MKIPTFSFAIFLGNSFGITSGLSSFRGQRRNIFILLPFKIPSLKYLTPFKLKKSEVRWDRNVGRTLIGQCYIVSLALTFLGFFFQIELECPYLFLDPFEGNQPGQSAMGHQVQCYRFVFCKQLSISKNVREFMMKSSCQ